MRGSPLLRCGGTSAISLDGSIAAGISRRKLFELLPEIKSKKVGRRRLILVRSLIERLEGGGEATEEHPAM